jgi:F-type H+-transporting ATPase subunit b
LEKLGILGPNLLFQIVNFLIILFLLNRYLYQPILKKTFAERQARISEGLAEADRVREAAAAERAKLEAQLAEERRTSQDRLREAVARSEDAARNRLAEANAEADRILAGAKAEAEDLRRQALTGLHGEIADLALLAASKVLQEGLDEPRHRALVDRFLKEQLGEIA